MYNKYWTEDDMETLEKASNFLEMAEIALVILRRMKKTHKPIVQICGQLMTNDLPTNMENMANFQAAVRLISQRGFLVFDQTVFQDAVERIAPSRNGEPYCWDIPNIFYRKIFESHYISRLILLPNWQISPEAEWQVAFAQGFSSIGIEEYSDDSLA